MFLLFQSIVNLLFGFIDTSSMKPLSANELIVTGNLFVLLPMGFLANDCSMPRDSYPILLLTSIETTLRPLLFSFTSMLIAQAIR
jgi:hypothetical protein